VVEHIEPGLLVLLIAISFSVLSHPFRPLWVCLLLLVPDVPVLLCPLSGTQVPGLSSAFGFDKYDNIACGTSQGDLELPT
jgi:hypothetical protein